MPLEPHPSIAAKAAGIADVPSPKIAISAIAAARRRVVVTVIGFRRIPIVGTAKYASHAVTRQARFFYHGIFHPRFARMRTPMLLAGVTLLTIVGCASTPSPTPTAAVAVRPTATDELRESAADDLTQSASETIVLVDAETAAEPSKDSALSSTSFLPPPIVEPASPQQSIEGLVAEAIARSPKALAARHRAAAAEQRVPQVTSYDNPTLGTTAYPVDSNSVQTAAGRIPLSVTLTQPLPWRDKLTTRGAVAHDEARRLWTEVASVELEVAEAVRRAAADYWFAGEAIRITRDNRELVETLETVAKARLRTGGSQQDVLAASLEADRLDNRILQYEQLRGIARADLAALLGRRVDALAELVVPAPSSDFNGSIQSLYDEAIALRPDLSGKLWAISRDRRKKQLACLERYPDFNVGLGWQSVRNDQAISPVANGNDNVSFMVGVTLPIWHDRINAGIREADQNVFASSRDYDATLDTVQRDLGRLVATADTLQAQLRLNNESLVPTAEQTLKVSLADYRGGKVTFVQLTQNYLTLLMLQTESARLRSEIAKAMASIDRVVGRSVSSNPMVVK